MKLPHACTFDLGNTLVPDIRLYRDTLAEFAGHLERIGAVASAGSFASTYTRINKASDAPFLSHTYGEESFFAQAFSELGVTAIAVGEALADYRNRLMDRMAVDPAIVEALKWIRGRGVKVVLLSNESVARVDAFYEKTGLRPVFDDILVSQAVGYEKPDKRIFELLLDRLDADSSRVVMFGDNPIADGACRLLGITFVLVTAYRNKNWTWEKGNAHKPDYVMDEIRTDSMERFLASWGAET